MCRIYRGQFFPARFEFWNLTLSIRTKSQNFFKQVICVKISSREIRLVKQVAFTLPSLRNPSILSTNYLLSDIFVALLCCLTKHIWHYLAELSSIALAHLSQYFSIIIAPSVLYLTNLVASSPHPIQNLEFFSELDVKGSILFNVFSNNYIFSNYIERRYIINT